MSRAYGIVFVLALGCAVALSARGHRVRTAREPEAPGAAAPAMTLAIELRDGSVTPALATVPKDHRVRLRITNGGAAPVSLRLAGYDDRVAFAAIGAGETRGVEFLADRPGADFTWLLDGRPNGRFAVTGSHLAGDHR